MNAPADCRLQVVPPPRPWLAAPKGLPLWQALWVRLPPTRLQAGPGGERRRTSWLPQDRVSVRLERAARAEDLLMIRCAAHRLSREAAPKRRSWKSDYWNSEVQPVVRTQGRGESMAPSVLTAQDAAVVQQQLFGPLAAQR